MVVNLIVFVSGRSHYLNCTKKNISVEINMHANVLVYKGKWQKCVHFSLNSNASMICHNLASLALIHRVYLGAIHLDVGVLRVVVGLVGRDVVHRDGHRAVLVGGGLGPGEGVQRDVFRERPLEGHDCLCSVVHNVCGDVVGEEVVQKGPAPELESQGAVLHHAGDRNAEELCPKVGLFVGTLCLEKR